MIKVVIKFAIYFTFPGIKESDTGLAPPALWDLAADKQTLQGEQPLQVKTIITNSNRVGIISLK